MSLLCHSAPTRPRLLVAQSPPMTIRTLLSVSLFSLLLACAADPGEGKTAAEVSEGPAEAPEAPPEAPAAAAVARAVDLDQTKIHAVGAKVTKQHDIDFKASAATLETEGDSVSKLSVTVDMTSLVADVDKLTGHLKSDDFFDVANHPTSNFQSLSITAGSDAEGATHTISGELTMVGTTNTVTFPATIATDDEGTITATAEFVIDRQLWGISYPGAPDDLIKDNVALTISIVAPPEG